MNLFKRGDIREDGKVFLSYKRGKEYWSTPEQLERLRTLDLIQNDRQGKSKLGHACKIIAGRKKYAKDTGVEFSVSKEELLKELPDKCPILGIPLSWGVRKGQSGNKDDSPSLDKFDPAKGYVPGNVFWMSQLANRLKNNMTTEQAVAVANWMTKIDA